MAAMPESDHTARSDISHFLEFVDPECNLVKNITDNDPASGRKLQGPALLQTRLLLLLNCQDGFINALWLFLRMVFRQTIPVFQGQ